MASKYLINNLCINFIFTNKLSDLFIDTFNFDTCSHHTLHKFIHKLIKYLFVYLKTNVFVLLNISWLCQ